MKKIVYIILVAGIFAGNGATIQAESSATPSFLQLLERDIQSLTDRLHSSVVTIHAMSRARPEAGRRGTVISNFVGSGIILDTAGHLITTAQVVEGRDRFLVELADHSVHQATLLGKNAVADVAVLQITASGLLPPRWGNSDSLRPGSIIITLGNSYGCPQAVSLGTVNGLRPDGATMQLNVAVSAGNSGGAVVNTSGEVVGLIKAKVSESSHIPPLRIRRSDGANETWYLPEFKLELPTSGLALAIPTKIAREAAQRIIGGSGDEYPYLGVYVSDLHSWLARYYHTDRGVVIGEVMKQTPAAKYGLKRGDLIRTFDDVEVLTVRHFRELIARTQPGDRVLFDIMRGGSTNLKVSLVMGRVGTPNFTNSGPIKIYSPPDSPIGRRQPVFLQPNDSLSIERLNEIRRRILEGSDSLGSTPVDYKIDN